LVPPEIAKAGLLEGTVGVLVAAKECRAEGTAEPGVAGKSWRRCQVALSRRKRYAGNSEELVEALGSHGGEVPPRCKRQPPLQVAASTKNIKDAPACMRAFAARIQTPGCLYNRDWEVYVTFAMAGCLLLYFEFDAGIVSDKVIL
jgi:hypothetical protein